MDPTSVMLGIRAAVRLYRAGNAAYAQHARDRDILLPMVNSVTITATEHMAAFLEINTDAIDPEMLGYWNSFRKRGPHLAGDVDMVAAEYFRIQALKNSGAEPLPDDATGFWMIAQWGKNGPIGPLGRVVVAMTDVALEFAARDPTLFGDAGRAEPIIKALALNMADLVPDDSDDLGPKNLLGECMAGIFLRASLKAMSDHAEALIEEEHLQALVRNTLPKLLEQLPDGLDLPPKRDVVEALLGPVASAAIATLADHPAAFFGHRLEADEPLGALTRTFLLKAADIGLGQTLTKTGAIALYRCALGLVAARPELFLDAPGDATAKLVDALFQNLAGILEHHSPPFDHAILTELLATTVDIVGADGILLHGSDQPWHQVFGNILSEVLEALEASIRNGDSAALQWLRSGDGLRKFVRIVLEQASRTPGMIGDGGEEIGRIVATVATAMTTDEHRLLSENDWLTILAVVVEEAAANPARLFVLERESTTTDLAAALIEGLLLAASAQWRQLGRRGGTVLFGPTLREAIVFALRLAAGNAQAARENAAAVQQLAEALNEVVADKSSRYGSEEWLRLYRVLIRRTLLEGSAASVNAADLETILRGKD